MLTPLHRLQSYSILQNRRTSGSNDSRATEYDIVKVAYGVVRLFYYRSIIDGLVKSRKTDFLPQHIGIMQDDDTICCGQNKMLGLFTRPSLLLRLLM